MTVRPKVIESHRKAFEAARLMLNDKMSMVDANNATGSPRSTTHDALLVLQYGTEAEIAAVESNAAPLKNTARDIVKRVPKTERTRRPSIRSKERLHEFELDAAIWTKLRDGLDLITSLPQPADVVAIVRKSRNRRDNLNRKLIAAYGWITEFSDAWTK